MLYTLPIWFVYSFYIYSIGIVYAMNMLELC